ncbi:hypothetical protein QN412_24820, partial [Pseudomonas sp. RTB3]|uniref:hypothetical protein n=1 Tax=Pseudomonas sp. RTB3 TaxID=3048633 RepID=UPI002B224275
TESEVLGQTPRMLGSGRHDKLFFATMWYQLSTADNWQGEIFNILILSLILRIWISIIVLWYMIFVFYNLV